MASCYHWGAWDWCNTGRKAVWATSPSSHTKKIHNQSTVWSLENDLKLWHSQCGEFLTWAIKWRAGCYGNQLLVDFIADPVLSQTKSFHIHSENCEHCFYVSIFVFLVPWGVFTTSTYSTQKNRYIHTGTHWWTQYMKYTLGHIYSYTFMPLPVSQPILKYVFALTQIYRRVTN